MFNSPVGPDGIMQLEHEEHPTVTEDLDPARLTTVQPDWPVSGRVHVHSTTRLGGVSQAPFHSLNFGLTGGDDPAAVQANVALLKQALSLPGEPRWLRQVHGNRVVDFPENDTAADDVITADGAATTRTGVVVAVLTADCLPVVLASRDGRRVAAVHAGWRGLAAGILESAVAGFDADEPLHAWLGPAIGPDSFQVGPEVRQAFLVGCASDEQSRQTAAAFVADRREGSPPGRLLGDLYALATLALNRQRAVSVYGGDCCTCTDSRRFHSYRRDGARSGRMATLAWLSP